MLRSKTRTQGRKYPRRAHWIERRNACFARAGEKCEISGDALRVKIEDAPPAPTQSVIGNLPLWQWKRAVDHLLPERWVRRFMPGADPHIMENLYCVSMRIHSMKTPIERRIYSGDFVGYCTELKRIGFTQEMIDAALKALNESAKNKTKV